MKTKKKEIKLKIDNFDLDFLRKIKLFPSINLKKYKALNTQFSGYNLRLKFFKGLPQRSKYPKILTEN